MMGGTPSERLMQPENASKHLMISLFLHVFIAPLALKTERFFLKQEKITREGIYKYIFLSEKEWP